MVSNLEKIDDRVQSLEEDRNTLVSILQQIKPGTTIQLPIKPSKPNSGVSEFIAIDFISGDRLHVEYRMPDGHIKSQDSRGFCIATGLAIRDPNGRIVPNTYNQ